MKGFTHFISATAVASCVPGAVSYTAEHTAYLLAVGGIFGILPDTIDFKLNQFLHKYDDIYEPAQEPDPGDIAAAIARNMDRAYGEKRQINMHLQTIRLGADLWRQYTIRFDGGTNEVVVEIGPVVNTGRVPMAGTEPAGEREGRAKISCPFRQNYDALTTVSIFSGPSYGFAYKDGRVDIHFIPWHRSWSHSVTLAAALGLAGWAIVSLAHGAWLYPGWLYGAVIMLGYCTHIIEDQFGFMGSNLFFPFTKERARGTHWMRSGDALPNFATVWLSVVVLFWNLYKFTPQTSGFPPVHLSGFSYLVYLVVIPAVLMLIGRQMLKEPATVAAPPEEDEEDEVVS